MTQLPRDFDPLRYQRITGYVAAVRVNGNISSADPAREVAEDIAYDVAFADDGVVGTMASVVPANRRFNKARVIAAKVQDFCDIIIDGSTGTSAVYIHTEKDDLYGCDEQPLEP